MSALKPVIFDGMLQRQLQQGDVIAGAEVLAQLTTAGAGSITGVLLANNIINRTGPVAGYTDTIDSAANIVSAILSPIGGALAIQQGTTWRVRFINTVAFAQTLAVTANTGVTLGTAPSPGALASSFKDWLITIINGNPVQSFAGLTTNASAVVTGMIAAQTALLSPGMVVTNVVAGLQGLTILSVQPGVGVIMSGNANATNTVPVAITLSPSVRIDALN